MQITMQQLQRMSIWVNWRFMKRDGKTTKLPLDPNTGDPAKSNDPTTWGTYATALSNVSERSGECNGIGIMFMQGNEYALCGIDIDGHQSGGNPLQEEVLELFKGTYSETSPSGTGKHILFLLPLGYEYSNELYMKNPHNELECYIAGKTNRYFTFMGNGVDMPVTDQTEAFEQFTAKYMRKADWQSQKQQEPPKNTPQAQKQIARANDLDIIGVARKARNGAAFTSLYDSGDIKAHNGDESAADLALCGMLAFYLQGNYTAIDIAFRSSALMRDKWEREDYRSSTINKAIAGCKGKFYTPPKAAQSHKHTGEGEQQGGKKERLDFDLFQDYLRKKRYITRNNEITHSFEYVGFYGENPEHINNLVPIRLKSELEKLYSGVSNDTIKDYVYWATANNVYNPILDIIEQEAAAGETGERGRAWDGVDRISEIYRIFGIEESDMLSRILIKKWLMQAYCGLYNNIDKPFNLDITLVFQGGQGIGKTRFFEKLALQTNCFGEGITIDPSDTDSVKAATSVWLGELGEIGSTMKKDMDKVKAFLTKATDEYRLPYARDFVRFPRRTSFVGTVNDSEFLIDQTGNRRFATVPIKPSITIDYDMQIKPFNALQLWVQVAELVTEELRNGNTYSNCFRLTAAEKIELAIRNCSFTKPLKGEIEVADVLTYLSEPQAGYDKGEAWITVTQFKQQNDVLRNIDSGTIGKVLAKLGYEKKIGDKRNKTSVYYLPYKSWRNNH